MRESAGATLDRITGRTVAGPERDPTPGARRAVTDGLDNAVVYGSGLIRIPQMVRAGVWLNLIAIALVTALALWLAPLILR